MVAVCRAGADDKEEFLATMVDQHDRGKTVGSPGNIEGWTKWVVLAGKRKGGGNWVCWDWAGLMEIGSIFRGGGTSTQI